MTTRSVAVRSFEWSRDGSRTSRVEIGDQHDFGDATAGLRREGYIRPADEAPSRYSLRGKDDELDRVQAKNAELADYNEALVREDAELARLIADDEAAARNDREAAASAMLAGKPLPDKTAVERARVRRAEIHRERTAIEDVRAALRSRMNAAQRRASIKVCEAAKDEHSELARQLAISTAALLGAAGAYRDLRTRLQREGVSTGGLLHDASLDEIIDRGELKIWFRRLADAGLIKAREIPVVI